MKTITVVTVCYNEEKNIARTIESVLMQTAVDYEYIICDGLSKDNTVAVAQRYQEAFAEKGISYHIYSERDNGIYDAMNKGVDKATGKYIWFLNAGDWLSDAESLKVFVENAKNNSAPAVYYANYYYVNKHVQSLCVCNADNLKQYMSIGHPAMVAKTDLLRERKFDTSYRIAADYNFVLGLKMSNLEFRYLDFPATCFLGGGISTTDYALLENELERIKSNYGLPHEKRNAKKIPLVRRVISKATEFAPTWLWKFWCVNIKHRSWIDY